MPIIKKNTVVPHSAEQMFQLVNAIEEYPQFIPWCVGSEVLSRNQDEIQARLNFAKGGLEKSFTTRNLLQPNKMVEIRLVNGPFRHLEGFWRFNDLENGQCEIKLDMEFEFSSPLLAFAFGPVFTKVANTLVEAFQQRAKEVYG
jgi:ribosome-associated toxin RatA of RatAB toxin-antitoxin module